MTRELLDLPDELLILIVLCLIRNPSDLETLTDLCLINRRIRSIAYPVASQYLCIEGDLGGRPHTEILPGTRESEFLELFDEERCDAVRYLTLTGHVQATGVKLLARLRNVTHLEISGAELDEKYDSQCIWMVQDLIEALPALEYLHLKDCYRDDEDFDEFRNDLKDDLIEYTANYGYTPERIISHSLRHIVCDNVDPAFRVLWLATPEVEVVEMHMCEFAPFETYRELGAHRMLLRDPVFCAKVKRLHVEHRLVDEEDPEDDDGELEWLLLGGLVSDAEHLHSFFEWRAHILISLEELILEVQFYLEHLPEIFGALPEVCPNLKKFKFEMSSRGYKDFIDHGRNSIPHPTAELECLEEVRLPFTGLDYDLVAALPCFFSKAPKLAHIYLNNPQILAGERPSPEALRACAEGYAAVIDTLRSVSWDRHATVEIMKTGSDTKNEIQAFRKPEWEQRRGIGGAGILARLESC
ncbi:hypothetical protein R3P38DRAFT_1266145 [Favolaschia claudopus]|uniref:F-box domain-containing protein n=1 Tax=Favolaschia claudopus TaxID=2862362 RepID=A0AAW0B0K8_9AGAR